MEVMKRRSDETEKFTPSFHHFIISRPHGES